MNRHQTIRQRPKRDRGSQAGFTLLELLVSVGIIVLLIGLLFPVLSSIRSSGRVTEVKEEIDSLADALEQFKAKYGEYPPSRITLHSSLNGSMDDPVGWNGDPRSKAIIRKYWRDFDFSSDGAGGTFISEPVHLDGAECLTFFLGGVRDTDGAYIGFSNNPAQPFTRDGNSRVGPFFPFSVDRLVDQKPADGEDDMDGFPAFIDPLPAQTQPYIYLSSYSGGGYKAADLDADGDLTDDSDRRMANYYVQPGGTKGWNPQSFQIISPGQDTDHGDGGEFDPDGANTNLSQADRDNLTNFHGGPLAE